MNLDASLGALQAAGKLPWSGQTTPDPNVVRNVTNPFDTIAGTVKDMPSSFYNAMSQGSAAYSQAMSHEQTHQAADALATRTPSAPMDLASHAAEIMGTHNNPAFANWSVYL